MTYVIVIVLLAFAFDFINGFHDSANAIATIVGTRVLSPAAAVLWAATFNFAAVFIGSTAVAKAVSSGFVSPSVVTANVICAALVGAIVWNIITWYFGIPSSSSHAIIGGFAGAAVAKAGLGALVWGRKWVETLSAIAISPLLGMLIGFVLMVIVYNVFRRATPRRIDKLFRPGQLLSSALLSVAHGTNDAQKTIGIIVALLVASK
ncbi:MAG TPA: inorganic phosphate transporter, partial [Gemmatimonadaceae bacterium]|nr:inorganic phosphate transporter [Gemmatimonadaceae bacterium]